MVIEAAKDSEHVSRFDNRWAVNMCSYTTDKSRRDLESRV